MREEEPGGSTRGRISYRVGTPPGSAQDGEKADFQRAHAGRLGDVMVGV